MGTAKAGAKARARACVGLYRASLAHIWPIAFSLSELRMPAGRRGRCSRLNSWYGLVKNPALSLERFAPALWIAPLTGLVPALAPGRTLGPLCIAIGATPKAISCEEPVAVRTPPGGTQARDGNGIEASELMWSLMRSPTGR